MEVKNKITPAIVQAAVAMLTPFVPEISPTTLVSALRNYNATEEHSQKPYTRQEVAKLLGCSLQTITRYQNRGLLRTIKITDRLVRIDPESVNALLKKVEA